MSIAEQKQKLHKFIETADENDTARLMSVVQQLAQQTPVFSEEDFAEFDRRSDEHTKDPNSAIPWEESLARIRTKLQK